MTSTDQHQPGCTTAHRAGTSPCTIDTRVGPFTTAQVEALAEALHVSFSYATDLLYRSLADLVEANHAEAKVDDLPCELCGEREQHIRHRGIGHTHTPAESSGAATLTPRQQAAALIALPAAEFFKLPSYVINTALMMAGGVAYPSDIVDMDHDEAKVEYRRVLAGRRLEAPCVCGGPHTLRGHGADDR
jgi:hypothetical protein